MGARGGSCSARDLVKCQKRRHERDVKLFWLLVLILRVVLLKSWY